MTFKVACCSCLKATTVIVSAMASVDFWEKNLRISAKVLEIGFISASRARALGQNQVFLKKNLMWCPLVWRVLTTKSDCVVCHPKAISYLHKLKAANRTPGNKIFMCLCV